MTTDNKKNYKNEEKDALLHLSLSLYSTFYPKYFFLETLLKNRLFQLFKEKLGENWFSLQMSSNEGNRLIKREVEYILFRKPNGFILNEEALLIESGFGIWVEFFSRDGYKEVKGLPILIFPQLPPTVKRKDLYQKLDQVRDLRNQLFHCRLQPITEVEQVKYLDKLSDANNDLIDLLKWLDAPLNGLSVQEFENKVEEIRNRLIQS